MKQLLTLLLLCPLILFSQKKKSNKVGQVTKEELEMKYYSEDTLADAVVLYEHANVYIDKENNYDFRTDYYFKIKLFNADAFYRAKIEVPLYDKERIKDIKAITYNLEGDNIKKTHVLNNAIFTNDISEHTKQTSFTFPKLKDGSVIEYTYSVLSPYSRLDDWYFQEEIPKIKSEYDATILGNYRYNIRLIGFQKLNKNEPSIKKNCIYVPGLGGGDCAVYSYGMDTIPAFEEEDFMLHKKNYMSRLSLDIISFTDTRGGVSKYTKTWKDVDNNLKKNFLDNQTEKKSYFKKILPSSIFDIENELDKAKGVYKYVQEKLFWNNNYWTRKKIRIKKTFEEGSGSVDAINLILYNCLKAAGLESYIVASSTRNNGLPTKIYPAVNDFNYILVKVVIDGKSYFLDATSKKLAFGEIPFKCLNGEGRVLDFKKEGYWEELTTAKRSIICVNSNLNFEEENLIGTLDITKSGYNALTERNKLDGKTEDDYLDDFESRYPYIQVNSYEDENQNNVEKPILQKFNITIDTDNNNGTIKFNPIIYGKTSINPFKLRERKFAVDYGYTRNFLFVSTINIPDNYKIEELPKSKRLALANSGGNYMYNIIQDGNSIKLSIRFFLLKKSIPLKSMRALKSSIIKSLI